jgi:protease-4
MPDSDPRSNPDESPQSALRDQPRQAANAAPAQIHSQGVIVRPRSFLSRLWGWMGWLGLLICLPMLLSMAAAYRDYFDTSGGIQEKFHSLSQLATDKIAVIEVAGTIVRGERGFVKRQIDRVRKDDNVKGVVLRVNSPGGSVSASDYILHHLQQLRDEKGIPIVVSMGGLAASGGYYVSMAVGDQEDSIFAEPTTTTGSIGVIVPHYNISGLMETLKVVDDSIVSHPRKRMLSMTRPESEEHREIIQKYVNQAFERFKEIVKSGRPAFREDDTSLVDLATGEIFSAPTALENGLVDRIGFIEDAIDRVIELARVDKDDVRVVRFDRRTTLISAIGFAKGEGSELDTTELLTPKAYYLWTTLPGVTAR